MAEYIDKDKFCHYLFKHIATFAENMIQMPVASTLQSVVNEIHEFQSEDVQPVKHGEWSQIKILQDGYKAKECSACKATFWDLYHWNYCPNCGARMDGEA